MSNLAELEQRIRNEFGVIADVLIEIAREEAQTASVPLDQFYAAVLAAGYEAIDRTDVATLIVPRSPRSLPS